MNTNHFTKVVNSSPNQNEQLMSDMQKELVLDLTQDSIYYRELNPSFLEEVFV